MSTYDEKVVALRRIATINKVEGFDPTPLAVTYQDGDENEPKTRLPVMIQMAWFRLMYPQGRIAVEVKPAGNFFVAHAKVYCRYDDPPESYLAEATASRGPLPEKPTVSPREWAQTAAIGIALRNAGFGLQFHAAGDAFDTPAVDELSQILSQEQHSAKEDADSIAAKQASKVSGAGNRPKQREDAFEAAKRLPCGLKEYPGKTLGDLIYQDPNALVWIAEESKMKEEVRRASKLICETIFRSQQNAA